MQSVANVLCILSILFAEAAAQDPGWPRELTSKGAKLVYYQPQVDEWKDYKELNGRMAVSLTKPDGIDAVGVIYFRLQTSADMGSHTVLLSNMQITKTYFPSQQPETATQL